MSAGSENLGVSAAALVVLRARYLRKDADGRVVETPGGMMDRVAGAVAAAEGRCAHGSTAEWAERFSALLRSRRFLPNSPTLMNAGTPVGILSGCFVLPVQDSLWSIFTTLRDAAIIHQAGGGTGFSFSALRPAGDLLATTGGVASGPVSFIRLYDAAAEVVRLGGRRRAASMAVLRVDHPDIEEFVEAKAQSGALEQFNLSVAVTDGFLRAVRAGTMHRLVNPRTRRTVGRVAARDLFDRICEHAWATGDPGLVFIDRVNRSNPLPALGPIEATNPCGEVPLRPYESCNLGSIDLGAFVNPDTGAVDRAALTDTARLAVRFLDDVIDVASYPTPELADAARATRKIGLGVMGLADALITAGIPYDSTAALAFTGKLLRVIRRAARSESEALAAQRGAYPLWAHRRASHRRHPPRRNAQLLSIAPTGTISLIAGVSGGIEPLFALTYTRDLIDDRVSQSHPALERLARRDGWWNPQTLADVRRRGTVAGHPDVPAQAQRLLRTALDIEPIWHVRMQAEVQRHVDAAVAKTVNLPSDARVDDVRHLFLAAWDAKVKGITVFRYGSRATQILRLPQDSSPTGIEVDTTYTGGCIGTTCDF